ncbi:folylpolyglutamate synthase [Xylona heveae TC161]|uniref:Folylpolyglutamate synthase n=1 Tax=Xylona heveae (strain CBS 132557 / TC161) TaxID=1328760 RepID=A0A165G7X4_XYLHT|nr:folylpolyglutamate synthase [Xylona heveae TC161]KZF21844.1 folylpolyglutamate synthase [Xylona heveae TC161]
MGRDYSDAVAALNTLQSNFAILDAIRKSGQALNLQAIPEMIEWCHKTGYEPAEFDRLNPIHIAGTKGKGSTSAFISSILSQYISRDEQQTGAPKLQKIGLYTSPHLRFVRERIQVNGQPISEEVFAKYFFSTWDRLEAAARAAGLPTDKSAKPIYFRFLTLMALHTYMSEGIDTAVMECGVGGEYDSTNILVKPTVTGISSLGIDHTAVLGETIEEIAWHKAGIMKPGAAAFTVPQPEQALAVIRKRAEEKGVELKVVDRHPEVETMKLGLAADFQKINASLAVAVAAAHLRKLGFTDIPEDIQNSPLPAEFRRGLEQVQWGGRCEIRKEEQISWHLDGGHTLESIDLSGKWFASEIQKSLRGSASSPASSSPSSSSSAPAAASQARTRILLFNQQKRDADALARALHTTLAEALGDERPFTHAVFCSNITFAQGGYKADLVSINTNSSEVTDLTVQNQMAQTWSALDPETNVVVRPTIEEAIAWVREVAAGASKDTAQQEKENQEVMVLVTGSVHLVGGVLEVLETEKEAKQKSDAK